MTTTGLDVFDTTAQKTMLWLKEIDEELGWEQRHEAYQALRGCLHEVRDRLPTNEMAHLAAQLPLLIRGIYYEGWDPSHPPLGRSADDFINGMIKDIPWQTDYDFEAVTRACLRTLSRNVDAGMARHVRNVMPESIRQLWPEI